MPDEYAIDAITALRSFVRNHPRYREGGQFLGGKSNRVLTGSWHGRPIVFKYYGEADGGHIGTPRDRQMREAEALRLLAPTGLVPELIEVHRREDGSGITVLARHRGRCLNWDRSDHGALVGRSFGAIWRLLYRRPLDQQACRSYVQRHCDGRDAQATVAHILERGRWLVRRQAPHDPALAASLARCAEVRHELASGPTVLVRLDNNPGNLLQVAGRVERLIDFEQVWMGTALLQEGILLDRELAGMAGIMAGYGETADHELRCRAAELSAWWRVLWNGRAWRREHGPDARLALGGDWPGRVRRRVARTRRAA